MQVTKKVIYNVEDFDLRFEPIEDSISIKKTKKGYTIKYLTYDHDGENPRDWDNFGHMVCFHNKYTFGDKTELNSDMFTSWEELEEYLRKEKNAYIILPLYVYDHSGLSMRTYRHGIHARWDCGQVGFIYVTKEDIKKNYMVKKVTKKLKEKSIKLLESEIDNYDMYLRGEIFNIVREDFTKDKKPIDYDIIGGYFGYKDSVKALETEI